MINLLLPFYVNFYAGEKTSSAKILPETKSYYYFVRINCPLREPFLDVDMLKDATKSYRIDVDDGEFNIVSSNDTDVFYLNKFKNSKKASAATQEDFIMETKRYPSTKY